MRRSKSLSRSGAVCVLMGALLGGPGCAKPGRASLQLPDLGLVEVQGAQRMPLDAFLVPSAGAPDAEALARCASGERPEELGIEPAMLTVTPGSPLRFTGQTIGTVDAQGGVDESTLEALGERLTAQRTWTAFAADAGCHPWGTEAPPRPGVLFAVDERVPTRTVGRLASVAARAGYPAQALLVLDPTAKPRDPAAAVELGALGAQVAVGAAGIGVQVGDGGRSFGCPTNPCASAGDYPLTAVREQLAAVASAAGDGVLVAVNPGIPFQVSGRVFAMATASDEPRFGSLQASRSAPHAVPVTTPSATAPAVDADGTVAVLVTALPQVEPPEGRPAMSREVIDEVIGANRLSLKGCYDRARALDETLAGALVVRFVIWDDGTVEQATLDENPLGDAMGACVLDVVRGFTFPRPSGGAVHRVVYPLQFGT